MPSSKNTNIICLHAYQLPPLERQGRHDETGAGRCEEGTQEECERAFNKKVTMYYLVQ
jgi:hypothetical protein